MGPSGSGKTSLLNFLSGRLLSQNIKIYGEICINGHKVTDINKYKNRMAYIMQDDTLLGTINSPTPTPS